jgi:hypothetical protein
MTPEEVASKCAGFIYLERGEQLLLVEREAARPVQPRDLLRVLGHVLRAAIFVGLHLGPHHLHALLQHRGPAETLDVARYTLDLKANLKKSGSLLVLCNENPNLSLLYQGLKPVGFMITCMVTQLWAEATCTAKCNLYRGPTLKKGCRRIFWMPSAPTPMRSPSLCFKSRLTRSCK